MSSHGASPGSPDDPISSLSKFFGDIVAFVNNEILIEDLKDLPALKIRHVQSMLVSANGQAREESQYLKSGAPSETPILYLN